MRNVIISVASAIAFIVLASYTLFILSIDLLNVYILKTRGLVARQTAMDGSFPERAKYYNLRDMTRLELMQRQEYQEIILEDSSMQTRSEPNSTATLWSQEESDFQQETPIESLVRPNHESTEDLAQTILPLLQT